MTMERFWIGAGQSWEVNGAMVVGPDPEQRIQCGVVKSCQNGSEILHLIAWDPDEGPNGVVTFSLKEENSGSFYVDGSTGVIRLTKPLDRETCSQHVFRAVATDGCSQGPRSSVATVTIQVEDINDNSPACINKPMRVSVSSITTRPSRPIITVTAQDPDHGDNGTIVFSLADEDEMFQVDESGAVRLKAPLSNEVYGTKLLRIRAADLGRPSLTSSCLVLIQLNGEEPLLQFTEELYEVTMPENSKTGSWVANVVAHDLTTDEGTIKFQFDLRTQAVSFDAISIIKPGLNVA
ncbi:protocadherin-23-like [Sinocyclocheilus anshuiensis]|uniref:protocadherin-23-like n=1 Tax=Sinocyclocheilus anshuiensis TaxID=1608454 RepID=UPI0007B92D1A|nr:PREDICTED: protocadherin-23-like [Sinocyclocheilus anshuiensis]